MSQQVDHQPGLFKVGVVNFINTAPFLIPFKEAGPVPGWQIVEDNPARLNRLLRTGDIQIGLISSYAFALDFKDYYVVRDYCISATGTVGSVVLYSRLPIYELSNRRICLTDQSATSINLLYIILEYFNGLNPSYFTGTFQDFKANPDIAAYLAIGDEALKIKQSLNGLYSYDLASIWYETTSLPFVFALWAVRRDSGLLDNPALEQLRQRLHQAYHSGRARIEEISAKVAGRIPMSQVECLAYLRGIEFDLSKLKLRGLDHFFRLLFQMGRLPGLPQIIEV